MLQPAPERVWGVALPKTLPRRSQSRVCSQAPGIVQDWLSDDRTHVWRAQDHFALLVRSIVTDVLAAQSYDTTLGVEERIARAESVAAQSLHLGLNVNEMARAASYERSYFSALYQRVRGEAPRAFLARIRLREAQRLLRDTDLTIVDIAARLGYHDSMAFIRMFSRHTGLPPGQWRRR